ncbi:MAG: hypothetical protein MUO64_21640 [Anaerolineales bacterium]|nr:hypothetical protein [Anaerolineales bacterium]
MNRKKLLWSMLALTVIVLLLPGCSGAPVQPTKAPVPPTNTPIPPIAENEPVIQPGSLVFLILPIEEAKVLSTDQNQTIDTMAAIYADQDLFADIEREFRELRTKYKDDVIEASAIDVVLREIQRFRSVYRGKSVLFEIPGEQLVFPGAGWAKDIEAALRSYGYVLLELGSDVFLPALPPEISKRQWEQSKANRILAGKWGGAVQISQKEILLPGLKCFEQ